MPLPGVVCKIVPAAAAEEEGEEGEEDEEEEEEEGEEGTAAYEEGPGELRVKGPNVFKCYFGRPSAATEVRRCRLTLSNPSLKRLELSA